MADIDLDLQSGFQPKSIFPNIVYASRVDTGKLVKHNVGSYFQNMPMDPVTELAAIPYKEAEDFGFFKIDLLTLGILDGFESKAQIRELLKIEPDWSLLENEEIVEGEPIFQLGNSFNIIDKVKPKSVIEVADCIALIRPYKRYLLDEYINNKYLIRETKLYVKEHKSDYRRSHAIAYASVVKLQLHLIKKKNTVGNELWTI